MIPHKNSCVKQLRYCNEILAKNTTVILYNLTSRIDKNLKNIGQLLNRKNIYFVPMHQDDPEKKPYSLVCDFDLLKKTMTNAFAGRQIMPIF